MSVSLSRPGSKPGTAYYSNQAEKLIYVPDSGVGQRTRWWANLDAPVPITVEAQGGYFSLRQSEKFPVWMDEAGGPSSRGPITEFSRKSRKRLIDTFNRVDKRRMKYASGRTRFITLTYPHNMQNYAQAKAHRRALVKRIRRRFPAFWDFWRLETQKRGAIHFHMICGGMGYIPWQELQSWWNEITGTEARNSLDGQILRSWNGVMSYAAKYLAKQDENQDDYSSVDDRLPLAADDSPMGLSMVHNWPGRFWGYDFADDIPFGKRRVKRMVVTVRTLRRWAEKHHSDYANPFQTSTIYCQDADHEWRMFMRAYITDINNNRAWSELDKINARKTRAKARGVWVKGPT